MKKIFSVFGLLISLHSICQPIVGTMPPQLCTGQSSSVSFSISGVFNLGNVFTLQLSDETGSFATPHVIGSLSGVSAGNILYTIPGGLIYGTAYNVRIISSNPPTTGPVSSANLEINSNPLPPVFNIVNSTVCPNSTQLFEVVTEVSVSSYNWTLPAGWTGSSTSNSISTLTAFSGGTVSVVAVNYCGNSTPKNISVSVPSVDDGNPCTVDFCSNGVVSHTIQAANVVCRASAGICDVPEYCNGVSSSCPFDQFLCATTICRASAGICDLDEECTGLSSTCPADLLVSVNTVCREVTGICDVAENCTGSSVNCPVDLFLPSTTVCRLSTGMCDVDENCNGTTSTCPVDLIAVSGTVCRNSSGLCDLEEQCDGLSKNCPTDLFLSEGFICRTSSGICDVQEKCSGTSSSCPLDVFVSASTVCRSAVSVCDIVENCTGMSSNCPSDVFKGSDIVCRSAAGICDLAELCIGNSAFCPADIYIDNTSVCRTSNASCDPVEHCTGSSIQCPLDVSQYLSSTISATSSSACPGDVMSVSFTINSLNSSTYTVELSDGLGSFSSPIGIGTYSPGPIGLVNLTVTIPLSITPTPNYKIRVVGNGCVSSEWGLQVNGCLVATWLGNTTDWNSPANWSNSVVPNSCFQNVYIPSGTNAMPTISTADFSVGNISIDAGVTLTLQGFNLNVCGNWVGGSGSDAVTVGSGTVQMVGTSIQQISGNTIFDRLLINNALGIVQNGTISILNRLSLENGLFDNLGTVTMLSTSDSHCATIDHFTTGFSGTFSGTIIAQRYIPIGGNNQHFMSSPLQSTSLTQFGATGTPGFVIPTSDCDETQLQLGSPYGTVFQFHEDQGAGCSLGGWEVKTSGIAENGRGYSIYQNDGLFTLVGMPQLAGSVALSGLTNSAWPIHTTLQGHPMGSGWNLVGNPFLSYLDLNTHPGFDNQAQVWVTNGPYTGTYQPMLMGSGSANLAPFQAFMVRRTSGSGNFIFNESECTNSPASTNFYKTGNSELKIFVSGNGFNDKTEIGFFDGATSNFDSEWDAYKFHSTLGQPTLFTKLGQEHFSINRFPVLIAPEDVPLGFEPGADGTYTLNFQNLESFDSSTNIYLEDLKTSSSWMNVRLNNTYVFDASASDDWSRFILHFAPVLVDDIVDVEKDLQKIQIYGTDENIVVDFSKYGEVKGVIGIYNLIGQHLSLENYNGSQLYVKDVLNQDASCFIVKVQFDNGVTLMKKVVLKQ